MDEIKGRLASFLSRKLFLVLLFEAITLVVLFSDKIDGAIWQTVTMFLAGSGILGNAAEKFAGSRK